MKTVFLHNFFGFLFQAPGYIETCVNGVTNCKTSKRALVPFLPGEMKFDITMQLCLDGYHSDFGVFISVTGIHFSLPVQCRISQTKTYYKIFHRQQL